MINIPNRVRQLQDAKTLNYQVWLRSYAAAHYGLGSLYGARYFINRFVPFDLSAIDWDFYSDYFEIEE